MPDFGKRRIGRTSVEVTELGLGCATLGGSRIAVSRQEAEAIVGAAWAAGVSYIERPPITVSARPSVASAMRCAGFRATNGCCRQRSDGCFVLAGPRPRSIERRQPLPFDPVYDYSYDGVMRSFEDSLQRLGLARIDILYVHDIGAMQHGQDAHPGLMRTLRDGGYRALEKLRAAGTVRAIGIGVNEREVLLEAMEWGDWDAFLLAGRYTLLEQAPLEDLIPKCENAGTSIVVGGPLNSGILAGRDTWNYKTAPPEIVARVNAIEAVCDSHRVPLAAAALQFPLAHPAVAAVIPGPRNVEEFHANVRLLRYPIPAALWADLRDAGLLHPHAPTPAG